MSWQDQVLKWNGFRRQPELAGAAVGFFERAFDATHSKAYTQAWFGVYNYCISLTLGRLWLASLSKKNQRLWLLVDQGWHEPVRVRNTPLGWWVGSWNDLTLVIQSEALWSSYTSASQIILDTLAASPPPVTVTQNKTRLPFLPMNGVKL